MPAPLHCPGCEQQIPFERLLLSGGVGQCPHCQYTFLIPRPEVTGNMADPQAAKSLWFVVGGVAIGVVVVLVCCGGLSFFIF
jgi:hypothetical protein